MSNESSHNIDIDTDGGTSVGGDVNIKNGDFVGRDKNTTNYYQIILQNPQFVWYFIGLLSITVLAVIVWQIFFWVTRFSLQDLSSSDFNIAVANFLVESPDTVQDTQSRRIGVEAGKILTDSVEKFLSANTNEFTAQRNQKIFILPSNFLNISDIGGDDLFVSADELKAPVRAVDLDIQLIVFGYLVPDVAEQWRLYPHFYVAERGLAERADDSLQINDLGSPILFNAETHEDIQRVSKELDARLNTLLLLIQGLDYFHTGNQDGYQKAANVFCTNADNRQSDSAYASVELLYFFCGHAHLELSDLYGMEQSYEQADRHLEMSLTSYRYALELNPTRIRSQLSLATVLLRYRSQVHECTKVDWDALDEARTLLESSEVGLSELNHLPAGTRIAVSYFLGDVFFWKGVCVKSYSELVGNWEKATKYYSAAIVQTQQPGTRGNVVAYWQGSVYKQLGTIMSTYAILADADPPIPEIQDLGTTVALRAQATTYYRQSADVLLPLATDAESRRILFSIMSFALTYFCQNGDITLVEDYVQEAKRVISDDDMTKHILLPIQKMLSPEKREECGL